MKLDPNKPFWKSLLLNVVQAAVGVIILVLIINFCLKIFTRHNNEISVPDFYSMSLEEANHVARKSNVRLDVIDSIYVKRLEPGAVFLQNPAAGSPVKKGRRILITINASQPKMIDMPNLVGFSLRQAKTELYSRGLSINKISYIEDIATNNVIEQRYKGRKIAPGEQVESESAIDLVLGLDYEDALTNVPYVCGYSLSVAEDNIFENSLNVGTVRYDDSVQTYQDTLDAVVYSQSPINIYEPCRKGAKVNLILTIDQSKLADLVPPTLEPEAETDLDNEE